MLINTEVLIVGAGLLGSSVAMHMSQQSKKQILIVDFDLEGSLSSSELNAGGVRAIWNHPLNAEISKRSIDYYETVADEIGFRQKGYFWMFSKAHWELAQKTLQNNSYLKNLKMDFLNSNEISKQFSFINKTDDLGGAVFSKQDGLLNPNLLKLHYRKIANENQVEFLDRLWIYNVKQLSSGQIELLAWKFDQKLTDEEIKKVLQTDEPHSEQETVVIRTNMLVNCSGAWARRFARFMGGTCASVPIRRQVSIFDCKEVDLTSFGMFVDSSGVYFHPEAKYILAGYATPEEPVGYNFEYDGEAFFEEKIWPALYERSSCFENLKHITGWAGLYEVSPDHNAIVGRVSGFENVFEAHSFSGHGAMQSYAAGLAVAELMSFGEYKSIDIKALQADRFEQGKSIQMDLLI